MNKIDNQDQQDTCICTPKLELKDRPLITSEQASGLMALFKVLANDTRLRILHALVREEGLYVTELANTVEMKPQAISNQLQRLVDKGIIVSKRNGNQICYRIVDPCVRDLIDRGLCLMEDTERRNY